MKNFAKGIVALMLSASVVLYVPTHGEKTNAKKATVSKEYTNKYGEKVWKQYGVGEYPTNYDSKEWKEMNYQETATEFFDAAYESNGEFQLDMLPESMEEYYENKENITTLAGYDGSSYYLYNPCNGAWCNYGTYTKYARTANCYKYISGEYTDVERVAMDAEFMIAHPSFTYLASSSKKYNCHSYAWIDSSANKYWLLNPNKYAGNTTYFKKLGVTTYKSGDKIIFDTNTHSVIMTGASKCKSKLGSLGVYKCTLSDALELYGSSAGNVSAYRPK